MKYKIYFCLILLIFLYNFAFGQPCHYWSFSASDIQDYPSPYRSDWERDISIWRLVVRYTGPEETRVRFYAEFEHERYGIVASGQCKTLTFRPNETKVLDNSQIIDWDKFDYNENLERQTQRTGLLPEGRYTARLSIPEEYGGPCPGASDRFTIVIPRAPTLVYPPDDFRVQNMNPRFQWTNASIPIGYPINYEVKVWHFIEGRTVEDIANNTRPFFSQTIPNRTEMVYPISGTRFEEGEKYVWAVEMSSPGRRIFRDVETRSEVNIFDYGAVGPLIPLINLPDTLIIGEFTLIVSNYDAGSTWDDLSGTAIWYGCPSDGIFTLIPVFEAADLLELAPLEEEEDEDEGGMPVFTPLLELAPIQQVRFHEFSEMRYLSPDIVVGGLLPLNPSIPGGIELNFSNLEAAEVRTEVGNVTSGTIHEVFDPPEEETIKGFDVDIHELFLSPDSASAVVTVHMPCLNDSLTCNPSSIGPFETEFDPNCNIYEAFAVDDLPNDSMSLGPFRINDLGILFETTDSVIVDLSDVESYGVLPADTALIIITEGKTIPPKDSVIVSNTGFLYGDYKFSDGEVTKSGFSAELKLADTLVFTTLSPNHFKLKIAPGASNSYLAIDDCHFKTGELRGYVYLPYDFVRKEDGDTVVSKMSKMVIDSNLSIYGEIDFETRFLWGGFGMALQGRANQIFRISAAPEHFITPIEGDSIHLSSAIVEDSLTGFTIIFDSAGVYTNLDSFYVYSPDVRDTFGFEERNDITGWLNIGMRGVSGHFMRGLAFPGIHTDLGILDSTCYLSDSTFDAALGVCTTYTYYGPNEYRERVMSLAIEFEFAGNASFDGDIGGQVDIPIPCGFRAPFTDLNVTSTANLVGGNAAFEEKELYYWGVLFSSEKGIMSVKTGQIIFTNAAVDETVHFADSFQVIWGEMFPDGNLGEFVFSDNTTGQKFDGFAVTVDSAGLSKFPASLGSDTTSWPAKQGALLVNADIHFPFFANIDTFINIWDYKYKKPDYPYYNRVVQIEPHYFDIPFRSWGTHNGNSVSDFDFDKVEYDSVMQKGFIGDGEVDYKDFTDSPIYATINAKPEGIRVCMVGSESHDLALGPFANVGQVAEIWGCVFIQGDTVSQMVVGGRLATTNGMIGSKTTTQVLVKLVITPTITEFFLDGDLYMWILNGRATLHGGASVQLYYDRVNYITEGFLDGEFSVKEGTDLNSTNEICSVEGQINWHTGDYYFLQAMLKVSMEGVGSAQGGFFIGVLTPISKIWVFNEGGSHGKFGLDTEALTQTGGTAMSGMYAFFSWGKGFDWGIVEGEYEMFVGAGLGVLTDGDDITGISIIGNVGFYLHGEIFWGFVSASGWVNLQIVLPYPFYFKGTLGLKGCVVWVACKSIELDIIIDHDGFHASW
ncbi:hypothetical protein JXI42_01790 [bacterium]|nr:hypothetical protein [bacterium]